MSNINYKKSWLLFVFAIFSTIAFAQGTLKGKILDAQNGEAVVGANVFLEGTTIGVSSSFDGSFTLKAPAGNYTVFVTFIGYKNYSQEVTITNGQTNDLGAIQFEPNSIGLSEVNLIADVAIDRETPVAVSTIKAEEIQNKLGNQEFPEAMKYTPSIYASKSSGGFGDARITVRGFSQENVALLINGIPVNGMEDNRVYWSNWAGLSDVTRTLQVQRGLGASKLAITSVGGTINIITKTTDQEKGGTFSTMIGNDNYRKNQLTLSSGRTENGWAVTFSGSRTTGDGYMDNGYIDAYSYFLSVAKELNKDHQLVFTLFGAPQRHGQRSFQHRYSDFQKYGIRYNDDWGYLNGEAFGWRDNFYHKPQAALNHYWQINEKTILSTSVYASAGRGGGTGDIGAQREFMLPRDYNGQVNFNDIVAWNSGQNGLAGDTLQELQYEMANGESGSGFIANKETGGIIKRASMNEHQWFGALSTLTTELSENLTLNAGVDLRWYYGDHYRKTVDLLGADYWFDQDNAQIPMAQLDWVDLNGDGVRDADELGNLVRPGNDAGRLWGSVPIEERIDYSNQEQINWYGVFGEFEYSKDRLSAFATVSGSMITYERFEEFNEVTPDAPATSDVLSYMGYNLKAGANYNIDENNNIFVNAGYLSRAPYFDIVFPRFNNRDINTDAVNEKTLAFEIGYGYRNEWMALNVNAYRTNWQDKAEQFSGNDVDGNIIFANILGIDALHQGIELDARFRPVKNLEINVMGSFGDWKWDNQTVGVLQDQDQNVLREDTFYLDGLYVGNSAQTTAVIGASYRFPIGLSIDATWSYYGRLYADFSVTDRTSADLQSVQPFQLPNYDLVDAGMTYRFKVFGQDATVRANVNNLFDRNFVLEAFDNTDPDLTDQEKLEDSRVWFGFGRTWNLGLTVHF